MCTRRWALGVRLAAAARAGSPRRGSWAQALFPPLDRAVTPGPFPSPLAAAMARNFKWEPCDAASRAGAAASSQACRAAGASTQVCSWRVSQPSGTSSASTTSVKVVGAARPCTPSTGCTELTAGCASRSVGPWVGRRGKHGLGRPTVGPGCPTPLLWVVAHDRKGAGSGPICTSGS